MWSCSPSPTLRRATPTSAHPEHLKAVARVGELGIIEDLLVIDYVPQQ